ncbi:hypothetical protein DFJ77DRAFT_468270 [Powellomyces hirtus]|nr:hypothetical protein DFJ77DRAFT_468270 [Powellomyces hirtus]
MMSKSSTVLPPLPTLSSRGASPLKSVVHTDEDIYERGAADYDNDNEEDSMAHYFAASASLIPPGKAQSYTAIFEDALEQLAVLGDIAGSGAEAAGTSKGEPRPSGNRIVQDQRALEDRYEQLLGEQNYFRKQTNQLRSKDGINESGTDAGRNSQAISNAKSHANSAKNLAKIQQERSTLQALINKTTRELREYRFSSLVVTVEEEYKKRNTLQETIDREREASQTLRALQKELGNEKRRLEDETNDRNQVIQQLKDTIQEINVLTNSEQKYIKKETKAHENSVRQRCQYDETVMTEERAMLCKRLEQESKAHEKIVDFLTRQREIMERQIQDWMGKYEEDTEAKVGELEAFKQKRSQDLDKFEELLAAYEDLEKVVEEDRQLKQVEADRVREEKLACQAATKIQRWYKRKLEARKELAKQAKSAKGKKGGKKAAKTAPASAKPTKSPATPKKK